MQQDDLSRSLVAFDQDSTLVAVVELSASSWLVAGLVPGLAREPLKKQGPDPVGLLRLLERWRAEAAKAGKTIARIVVAFEAGPQHMDGERALAYARIRHGSSDFQRAERQQLVMAALVGQALKPTTWGQVKAHYR